mmetsp:Transcript_128744/g.191873  ORF Transcript_128744/g.191873 Transcript_128744/m.191873 type:complete len:235 (-) Transcript_128744:620-1324(-)
MMAPPRTVTSMTQTVSPSSLDRRLDGRQPHAAVAPMHVVPSLTSETSGTTTSEKGAIEVVHVAAAVVPAVSDSTGIATSPQTHASNAPEKETATTTTCTSTKTSQAKALARSPQRGQGLASLLCLHSAETAEQTKSAKATTTSTDNACTTTPRRATGTETPAPQTKTTEPGNECSLCHASPPDHQQPTTKLASPGTEFLSPKARRTAASAKSLQLFAVLKKFGTAELSSDLSGL